MRMESCRLDLHGSLRLLAFQTAPHPLAPSASPSPRPQRAACRRGGQLGNGERLTVALPSLPLLRRPSVVSPPLSCRSCLSPADRAIIRTVGHRTQQQFDPAVACAPLFSGIAGEGVGFALAVGTEAFERNATLTEIAHDGFGTFDR